MDIVVKKTILVLNSNDWKKTEKGERKEKMLIKGIALRASWDAMKNHSTKPARERKFPKMIKLIKKELKKEKVNEPYDKIINNFLKNVYGDPMSFRILKHIDKYATDLKSYQTEGHHLRFIEEENVCNAVIDYITENEKISSIKYVQGLIYRTHMAFYHIGREYGWGDQEDIRLKDEKYRTVLMNGGNPFTKSSMETIRETFINDIKPQRQPKFQIEDMNGDTEEWNKLSKPGSIAVVFHVMSTLFANILKSIRPDNGLNDMRPIENWVNVLMLYYFLIHEGARPGDTIGWRTNGKNPDKKGTNERGQQHENMKFSFKGTKYNILVLAFVKPSTLAYFLGEGQLKRYVCSFYKGKCAGKKHIGEYRGRVKSWMPLAYNMLDLATMYIILMRIKLVIARKNVGRHIFKKGQNISLHLKENTSPLPDHRSSKQEYFSVNVEGLTSYSIRYAAAEEERDFHIDESWTRTRMGHTYDSEVHNWYSENKRQRLSFIGEDYEMKLGSELNYPLDVTNSANIPLLQVMHINKNALPVNKCASNLTNEKSKELTDELNTLSELINPIVRGETTLQKLWDAPEEENVPHVKKYLPKDRQALCDELKSIPLGMHFKFSNGLLSEETTNELNKRLEYIGSCFEKVEVPENPQEVWTYPQVMWGEWNQELKAKVVTMRERKFRRQMSQFGKQMHETFKEKDLSDSEDDDDEVSEDEGNSEDSEPREYKQSVQIDGSAHTNKRPKLDYNNASWKGRMIAVICNIPGRNPSYEYQIPGTDHYVWIGRVLSFEKMYTHQFKVYAVWYKGCGTNHPKEEEDMTPSEDVSYVYSPSEGLIHWWRSSKTHATKFRIPEDDFFKIKEHLDNYWKSE